MYTYKLGGMLITDELYHDDLEAMTFGRKDQNELMHYGIKGQSWGKRRFQNEDGSLTMAGRNRYDVGDPRQGVTAYSDTGGRGGSGVNYYRTSGTGRPSTSQPAARAVPKPQSRGTGVQSVNKSVAARANSGKKAADSLFGRIGNLATNAAKDVGKAATNAYNGASRAVNNAVDWVGDRARDVGNLVSNQDEKQKMQDLIDKHYDPETNTFDSDENYKKFDEARTAYSNHPLTAVSEAGKWIGDRAKDVGNAATNVLDDVSATARGVADSVGNRLTGNIDRNTAQALRDLADHQENPNAAYYSPMPKYSPENLRKEAEEYQRKADNSLFGRIGNAAKDVGNVFNDAKNWVGDRARDVGNLVSNQDEKRAAENAQNVADRILDDAIARSGEYVPDEKGGEDLYIRDYNDAKVVDAADKRAADARQAYENHPLTKIQNAANDVKSLFSDGSKEREALAEARSKVDKYADDPEFMSYFYKDNPEEAKRFADEQVEARKQLKQAENNYMDFSNNPVNTVARALNLPNNKGNWAFAVPGNEQYLQTMKTGFIPKTENIGDWFTGNNYKRTADTHNQYAKDYEDLADQAYTYGRESAETGRGPSQDWWNSEGDYIKNVYAKEDRDIADANMNMYNNAPRQKIVNAANQVGETVSGVAKDVGDWASNAASDVRDWGAGAIDKGRQAFENLFGRSEPVNNTIPEQRIEEQRIPEQMIYEQTIPEQLIREEQIREKRR